ncbi:hypothetical protein SAMN05444972_11850 [Marininema halotolerans]|uniref:Uncharacterized protein n=2 Tax=Marininema halotolerans TaxID=1155944 RepID=A0A1I6UNK8_9BACL|nr:hypothetical protein SAMN05444972_11850 [Marininema halotolerans]
MVHLFSQWIENAAESYFGPGIEIEFEFEGTITNIKENEFIGEVRVWDNGILELQIADFDEKTVLYEYHLIDENVSFDHLLSNYREVFQTGRLKTKDTLRTIKIDASYWNGDWDVYIERRGKDWGR